METNYKPRKFKIAIRETFKGRKARGDFSKIQGKEVLLIHCGWQGEDELYPNEEMLMPDFNNEEMQDLFKNNDLIWFASGDLIETNA